MEALVYHTDPFSDRGGWLQFADPLEVLLANDPSEVIDVLQQVENCAETGCYCVGYVSYEAAPAFDADLVCHAPGAAPLAAFGVFANPRPAVLPVASSVGLDLQPELSQTDFAAIISRIKHYQLEGDTYQVNFTHRLKGEPPQDIRSLFARLVRAQPSRYAALLQFDGYSICSVSPELFFEKAGSMIRTEPMKGTRPRGRTLQEDLDNEKALRSSEKDRAENLMIVDMIRNDLGRLARPGTVRVDDLFAIKKLPTVWQQVSRVSAETDAGLVDIFRRLFPCASVTGAPRHRTMEIIAELEDSPRGVYTGAIGVIQPGNHARFSVGIRTLVVDEKSTYGVGGGIVWDSEPTDEWRESLIKSDVLRHHQPLPQLLETMRYDPAQGIWLVDEHLQRLAGTAGYFDYEFDAASVRHRLSVFRAQRPLRLRLLLSADGHLALEEHELAQVSEPVLLKLAKSSVDSQDIFLFHKTTNRTVYESRLRTDCDDVILFNERGELTETTISNIFLEIEGQLLTPDTSAGLLAGTFRQHLLDSGKVKTACLYIEDLGKASQLFVGNSVRGLIPAVYESG